MKIKATILGGGGNTTGIEISQETLDALGTSKRPPVKVTINGYTYRTSIASMGGTYMMSVSAEVRANAGVKAGDVVDVEIELDTEVRTIAVPEDLASALEGSAEAKKFFEGLSYSNKRRIVEPIVAIKSPENRQRRIEKTVEKLAAGQI